MIYLEAVQIAEYLNLKGFRQQFNHQQLYGGNYELFYLLRPNSYFHLLHYGVVSFLNIEAEEKQRLLEQVKPFATNWLPNRYQDELTLEYSEKVDKAAVTPAALLLPQQGDNTSYLRLAMLNTAQSVALDYYEQLVNQMTESSQVYTRQLEKAGRINVSKRNLLRFIGRTLNIKNSIVDNLYILDDPGLVWDDPDLDRVNKGLKDTFDIHIRFRDLDYKLRIVEDNLKLFTNLLQHRESARLEWIIIILIFFEIVNVLWREFL